MNYDHKEVVALMVELGCTGERITSTGIEERIEKIDFKLVTLADNKFMFCGIKMIGGFVATGPPAACIDPDNWRDVIGKKISFNNTINELYKLEAYRKMANTVLTNEFE